MEEATVDTLIETKTKQWNYVKIDGIFEPQEAEIIKTIPLALFESDDIVFWPSTKDGKYTYKSGYHFQKEKANLEQGDDFEIQVKQQ
nr:hypothetical protein CFP56_78624 [Quercus suber]